MAFSRSRPIGDRKVFGQGCVHVLGQESGQEGFRFLGNAEKKQETTECWNGDSQWSSLHYAQYKQASSVSTIVSGSQFDRAGASRGKRPPVVQHERLQVPHSPLVVGVEGHAGRFDGVPVTLEGNTFAFSRVCCGEGDATISALQNGHHKQPSTIPVVGIGRPEGRLERVQTSRGKSLLRGSCNVEHGLPQAAVAKQQQSQVMSNPAAYTCKGKWIFGYPQPEKLTPTESASCGGPWVCGQLQPEVVAANAAGSSRDGASSHSGEFDGVPLPFGVGVGAFHPALSGEGDAPVSALHYSHHKQPSTVPGAGRGTPQEVPERVQPSRDKDLSRGSCNAERGLPQAADAKQQQSQVMSNPASYTGKGKWIFGYPQPEKLTPTESASCGGPWVCGQLQPEVVAADVVNSSHDGSRYLRDGDAGLSRAPRGECELPLCADNALADGIGEPASWAAQATNVEFAMAADGLAFVPAESEVPWPSFSLC